MKSDLILIAMSGGVDSSVAAAVLKEQEHQVVGVTMSVWEHPEGVTPKSGACCSLEDADDARRVAETLGIAHYTLNVKKEFKEKVVDQFVGEYLAGRTPNPCVMCNQTLKFDYLFKQGEKFGAKMVATGHYAQIGSFMGYPVIMRGKDKNKDQSYFLFSTPGDKLDHILFPLGGLAKTETRDLALKFKLNVARKSESQEICFIPDDDYGKFIEQTVGMNIATEGDIINSSGEKLGKHKGYMRYTIGQRKGLGIASREPLYVTGIDPVSNTVIVGNKGDVYSLALVANRLNWFIPPEEATRLPLTARIRSRSEDAPATVTILGNGGALVEFAEPQLAIAPGQGVVFYHGEVLVGGGWIEKGL